MFIFNRNPSTIPNPNTNPNPHNPQNILDWIEFIELNLDTVLVGTLRKKNRLPDSRAGTISVRHPITWVNNMGADVQNWSFDEFDEGSLSA